MNTPPLTQTDLLALLRRTTDEGWLNAMLAQPDGLAVINAWLAIFAKASEAVSGQVDCSMISTAPAGRCGVCTLTLQRTDTTASATIPKGYTFITNLGVELTVACDVQIAAGQSTISLPLVTTRQIDLVNTVAPAFDDILDMGDYPDAILSPTDSPIAAFVGSVSGETSNYTWSADPTPVAVGTYPIGVAISPDGTRALVTNYGDNNVTPLTLSGGTWTAGTPVAVGAYPVGVAISPDGTRALVTNYGDNNVTPLTLSEGTWTAGTPVAVGAYPQGVAISPDGARALVTNSSSANVTPLTLSGGTWTAGTPVAVGTYPIGVAISPDGARALVANISSNNTVTPLTLSGGTWTAGTPVAVGANPYGVAISPDGTRALVANYYSNNVTPLTLSEGTWTAGTPVAVGTNPVGVAISPDGARALVANINSNNVTPLTLSGGTWTAGTPVAVGTGPFGVAISPDGTCALVTNYYSNNVTPLSDGVLLGAPHTNASLTYVSSSPITGAVEDWLSAHGNERGCIRQDGEDGEAYRARVRMIPDAVSPLAIARAVDASATALPERWLAEPFNDGADPSVKLAANLGFFDGVFCDSDFCDDPLGTPLADKQPVANLECSGIRESRAYVRVDLVGQLREPDGSVLYCDDGFCDDPQWGYPDIGTHPAISGAEQALLQEVQGKLAGGVQFDVYLENSTALVQQGSLSGTTGIDGVPVITLMPVDGTAWYLREGLLTADMGPTQHWTVTGQGIAVRLTLDDGTILQTPWAQGVVSLRSYELEALGYRGQRVTSIEGWGLTLTPLVPGSPGNTMNLIGSFTVNTCTL